MQQDHYTVNETINVQKLQRLYKKHQEKPDNIVGFGKKIFCRGCCKKQQCMKEFLEQTGIVEERLGYLFTNKDLLTKAFTHKSYLNESDFSGLESNERLEFLGDSVLNLYVTSFLFTAYPTLCEGALSKYKSVLICQTSCAQMIDKLQVIDFLIVGKGEQETIKERPSISSDLFEAIVGAIFLDGGYNTAASFLEKHFVSHFQETLASAPGNAKAELQEITVKKTKNLPEYRLLDIQGPPHERTFTVGVFIDNVLLGRASGKTKRMAEQEAASKALPLLKTS
jgi:ribonuclease III